LRDDGGAFVAEQAANGFEATEVSWQRVPPASRRPLGSGC
jgi:hypothetical protein